MLSIITAVHDQLPMNRLFWTYLCRNTASPFELVVIDNASTDGSAAFFESVGARVIRNPVNFSYPHSQNQGLAFATGERIAFLNNDVIVSPRWDVQLVATMAANGLDVATSCGIEQLESREATRAARARWHRIKAFCSLAGVSALTLRAMHHWMYRGDWNGFCARRHARFRHQVVEGFVGNTVMMTRSALEKLGPWDEAIQAADFDLYLRSKKRAQEVGDIRPVHIALDTFNHHFIRLTLRANPPPFADADRLVALESKWSPSELAWLQQRVDGGC